MPFLKDRNIDERRAKLLSSGAQLDQVTANVESRLLQFQRFATQAYWDWVASGQAVQIQRQLLQFAETRVAQIKTRVEKGDLATIAQIDNDRLIAKRKNDLIKARRLLEKINNQTFPVLARSQLQSDHRGRNAVAEHVSWLQFNRSNATSVRY